jgi:hypothetical protein
MPEPYSIEEASGTVADDFVRFAYRYAAEGKVIRLDFTLRGLRDSVPPEEAGKHIGTVDQIKQYVGYEISRDAFGHANREGATGANGEKVLKGFVWVLFVGPFLIFGTLMGVRRVREKRRVNQFKQRLQTAPGAGPANAIPLGDEQEMFRHLSNFRSACGAPLYQQGAELQRENLSFDGRRLTAIALRCQVCGETRDIYFAHGS